jgi:nucleoside-diphosphate-sugar epimerase
MLVAIAGGHGRIARRLTHLLVAHGEQVRGLIRNPDHAEDLRADGAEPVVCDIEHDGVAEIARAIAGADAVVFAAGAGPGSGAERKWTMDYGGAVKLIEAARAEGARRYVMLSSIGAGHPPAEGGGVFGEYLRAKAKADRELEASGLDYTIVRPGGLTDDPGTGLVTVGQDFGGGRIPRADVAATIAACLVTPATIGKAFEVISGETPIAEALEALQD